MHLVLRRPSGRAAAAAEMALVLPPPGDPAGGLREPGRRQPGAGEEAADALVPLAPRAPHAQLPFSAWHERHAYYLNCMAAFIRRRVEAAASTPDWDWDGLRASLARFAYRTSGNRRRRFVLLK